MGAMVRVVLLLGVGGRYCNLFDGFCRAARLAGGWGGEDDLSLYKLCATAKEAADHIEGFYRVYHSSRYIKDDLVIRLKRVLSDADVAGLNKRFASLIKPGGLAMHMRGPFPVEDDHLGLPRLVFTHTRHAYGKVRQLIDAINACGG
ncbi:MAG: LOG family protein, partial [bacterium]